MEETRVSLEELLEHFSQLQTTTTDAVNALAVLRERVAENERKLESPQGAYEYIDFFSGFFSHAASEVVRVAGEVPVAPSRAHIEALRQLANNAAAEQRRTLQFRDKWINKPLPYEDVRPLLTEIANVTRDLIHRYRDLTTEAAQLEAIVPTEPGPPADGKALDRRELFTKWFGR